MSPMQLMARRRAALATLVVLIAACSSNTTDEPTSKGCADFGGTECGSHTGCIWDRTRGVCETLDPDAGWVPCPTDCKSEECTSVTLEGDDHDTCILRPDCTGLDEATCRATIGCEAVIGKRIPDLQVGFAGCADAIGIPSAIVTCTAPGPNGPCWYLGGPPVPSGWQEWGCSPSGPGMTFEECMKNAPF